MKHTSPFLTDAQLRAELKKCEYCEEKPCQKACPCDCSPADFIQAMQVGLPSDVQRAAALILSKNPLGGVCGLVCPDRFCMAACVHKTFNGAVKIPEVQATIIQKAKQLGKIPSFNKPAQDGKRIAIVGSGPAGLSAAAVLAQHGHEITIFEKETAPGGMCRCIPDFRLEKKVLASDIEWLISLGKIRLEVGQPISHPQALLSTNQFEAVIVATGLWAPMVLGIPGEDMALHSVDFLKNPTAHSLLGTVAIVGGGATAFDCAMTALNCGARRVELFALETLSEMPLTLKEQEALLASGIDVNGRTRVTSLQSSSGRLSGISTVKVQLKAGQSFAPNQVEDLAGTSANRPDVQTAMVAIGLKSDFPRVDDPRVFYAGDCALGPTTVVEAAAAGKEVAEQVEAMLQQKPIPGANSATHSRVKSYHSIRGYNFYPVPLETDFFGRSIRSPFLLSAAPPTDGLEQMKKAYTAGWAGGIMKTAFDGIPIHIPAEYMFAFNQDTYANCDNVSGHSLDRVCREIAELVHLYPDRLTIASTGGPVSGNDEADAKQWQSNTQKLENAGAMAIEYSLSCPQGGDGTEGDIVSQNAQLSAKIVDWILAAGAAEVPKLFKLTGAVTSVAVIVQAIKEVFIRYPEKKAGITLANSFPTLAFRPNSNGKWDAGVIVGASGAGILNISYLSLVKAAPLGVAISGNGGPMDYQAAANFMALGARTVQFCTLVMKYGYGIIEEMNSGLSHLMAERGIQSVTELIGCALPHPVVDFMALSPVKKISAASRELCLKCGNCSRCPYLAISNDADGYPQTAPERCVGCGICALKCFAQAITMRERTPQETAALRES